MALFIRKPTLNGDRNNTDFIVLVKPFTLEYRDDFLPSLSVSLLDVV